MKTQKDPHQNSNGFLEIQNLNFHLHKSLERFKNRWSDPKNMSIFYQRTKESAKLSCTFIICLKTRFSGTIWRLFEGFWEKLGNFWEISDCWWSIVLMEIFSRIPIISWSTEFEKFHYPSILFWYKKTLPRWNPSISKWKVSWEGSRNAEIFCRHSTDWIHKIWSNPSNPS